MSDVCLSRTSGLSREQRGPGRPKLAQPTSHVTRRPLSRSKVKVTALLTAAFTHQEAAALALGTYSPWEPTATLRSGAVGSVARGASAPTEGGDVRVHIMAAACPQLVIVVIIIIIIMPRP